MTRTPYCCRSETRAASNFRSCFLRIRDPHAVRPELNSRTSTVANLSRNTSVYMLKYLNSKDLAVCDTVTLAFTPSRRHPKRQAALLLLLPTILIALGNIIVVGGAGSSNRVRPASTQPSVPPQPTKPEDLCSVEGQVVNAVIGDPVRRASVR